MLESYQSSPDLQKYQSQSPILIQEEHRALIDWHPHWHDYQQLKEEANQNRNDKYLK